jgi:hypothetical protein
LADGRRRVQQTGQHCYRESKKCIRLGRHLNGSATISLFTQFYDVHSLDTIRTLGETGTQAIYFMLMYFSTANSNADGQSVGIHNSK